MRESKLFRIHCLTNRLSLVGNHIMNDIPELTKFENDIKALAVFVSAQRASNDACNPSAAQR